MAYETGTASGVNDMLSKLATFASAQGWTLNRNTTAGSGRELCVSKGSAYFNFRSYENESVVVNGSSASNRYGIALNGSDGYSGGAAWDRQAGYPLRGTASGGDQAHANLPLPIYTSAFPAYHLFAPNANVIYLELEVTTGTFQRLGFGSLDLFNPSAPGGGRFFYATGGLHPAITTGSNTWLGEHVENANHALELVPFRGADYILGQVTLSGSYVRAAFDSFDNWCFSGRSASATLTAQRCNGGGIHDEVLRDFSPNPLNGVGILLPNIVSVNRSDQYLSPVGVMPGLRYMDMTNYQPGDEFTLGADTWKVFPWYAKGGLSYQRAIALLKVA